MALYNGLPLFDLDIVEEINGVELISLVDRPAVQREFIKFNANKEIKFAINEERRVVTGVALIPDQKIYREEDGQKFYVQFSKEAVERVALKFFADHNSTNVNLQHQQTVGDCVYFESFLMDHKRNIAPAEFADLPDGTWIVSCKINNDEVWELVKDGTLRGFSIEGSMHISEAKDKAIDSLEELMEQLNKY